MLAHRIVDFTGPDDVQWAEVDEPAADGGVLIDVAAAGVSFADLLQTRGAYQMKVPLPYTPGMDAAGVVRSAPPGTGLTPGQRVAVLLDYGCWQEVVSAPAARVLPLPDGMSFEAGAAAPLNYLTALFALARRAQARWLLHDHTVSPVDRVAGLLVLLYAQTPAAVSRLTLEHVQTAEHAVHLRLGREPVTLPEPLAGLVLDLITRHRGHAALGDQGASPWLFPGGPGQPISAYQLADRLRQLGLRPAQSRTTALFGLATELPAAVLARLLGIHIKSPSPGNAPLLATGPPTPPTTAAANQLPPKTPNRSPRHAADRHSDSCNNRVHQVGPGPPWTGTPPTSSPPTSPEQHADSGSLTVSRLAGRRLPGWRPPAHRARCPAEARLARTACLRGDLLLG